MVSLLIVTTLIYSVFGFFLHCKLAAYSYHQHFPDNSCFMFLSSSFVCIYPLHVSGLFFSLLVSLNIIFSAFYSPAWNRVNACICSIGVNIMLQNDHFYSVFYQVESNNTDNGDKTACFHFSKLVFFSVQLFSAHSQHSFLSLPPFWFCAFFYFSNQITFNDIVSCSFLSILFVVKCIMLNAHCSHSH